MLLLKLVFKEISSECQSGSAIHTESPIVRRLLFKSKYTVTCDALTTRTTQRLLESVLSHKRNQLQNVCAQGKFIPTQTATLPTKQPLL